MVNRLVRLSVAGGDPGNGIVLASGGSNGLVDPRVTCANAAPRSGGADDQPSFVIVSTGGNDSVPDLFQRRAS